MTRARDSKGQFIKGIAQSKVHEVNFEHARLSEQLKRAKLTLKRLASCTRMGEQDYTATIREVDALCSRIALQLSIDKKRSLKIAKKLDEKVLQVIPLL